MFHTKTLATKPSWSVIPIRVLLVTFLLTLLAFAVSLLLGILGLVIAARLRGLHPNMATAYRHVALPAAAVVSAIVLDLSQRRGGPPLPADQSPGRA